MKVLFVATPECGGHHFPYFEALLGCADEAILVTEKKSNKVKCRQYYEEGLSFGTKSFKNYFKMIKLIRKVCLKEKPDVIHIQCGDNIYRFFGLGLGHLGCDRIVITFHRVKMGGIRDISMKNIYRHISFGVVHTSAFKNVLNGIGINNVVHVEYPQFTQHMVKNQEEAKQYFGLDIERKVLAVIGNTRYEKGLDILLKALKNVPEPFQLLVAGKESEIKKEAILDISNTYKDKVKLKLEYLTDEELSYAFSAADYIVLPYRKTFDAASGPLTEGVAYGKTIIGSNHGSLGQIISINHIGYTFESESVEDLTSVLKQALRGDFEYDEIARQYQLNLKPDTFRKKYCSIFENAVKNSRNNI